MWRSIQGRREMHGHVTALLSPVSLAVADAGFVAEVLGGGICGGQSSCGARCRPLTAQQRGLPPLPH